MPGFVRKILIFITGYAWLILLAGPGLAGMAIWSSWKADGDHAFTAREQLQTVAGTVTGASEVTVKRKRRSTKQYYEITVKPDAGGEERKLRIAHSEPKAVVGGIIDEKVTALYDSSDSDIVYEVVMAGKPVISYEATRTRMQAEAASTAQSFSGAGIWILAVILTLLGAAGVWSNRKLRRTDELAAA
ncbi:MAG: hypothetical protein V4679_08360 [Pseudomonadota bacterium]